MIGSVIHHVQQDGIAAHRALTAADEDDVDDFLARTIGQTLGIANEPVIYRGLRDAQLGKGWGVRWVARGESVRPALQVRLPHEIHAVNVIQRTQHIPEHARLRFGQFFLRKLGKCRE